MLVKYSETLESNMETYLRKFRFTPMDLTKKDYIVANIFSEKNKFNNILPSDESRVKCDDRMYYINANHVLDNYIATQQPDFNTAPDFWKMIYEKNCSLIVNLSGNNSYLPFKDAIYNDYVVRSEDIIDTNIIKIKNVYISHIENPTYIKTVYHATFTSWPDFGVPDEREFTKLFDAINMIDYMSHIGPIVVHCRAGVGRSGTFILIHYILKKIRENQFPDPIDVLIEMRQARCNMVQEVSQFAFALKLIVNKIKLESNKVSLCSPRKKLTISCD